MNEKISKFDKKIRDSKILKDLDEKSINSIIELVNSSIECSEDVMCKKMIDEGVNECFENAEKIFMPYIKHHKNIEEVISEEFLMLQEKNLKRITKKEDIENAKDVFLQAEEYLTQIHPKIMKKLKRLKKEYSIREMNKGVNLSLIDKLLRVKLLSFSYKLINVLLQIHTIFEEELNSTSIKEINNFLKLEIEVAEKIQQKDEMNTDTVYEQIIFDEQDKIPIQYKLPTTYNELTKLAEKQGFYFCRQCKTSHAIYKNKNNKIVVIPDKGKTTVPAGTQLQILKRIFIN